eukprot:scaffold4246_cov76-Skeletonema_dohrnii-CCMP3373.AAC.3
MGPGADILKAVMDVLIRYLANSIVSHSQDENYAENSIFYAIWSPASASAPPSVTSRSGQVQIHLGPLG